MNKPRMTSPSFSPMTPKAHFNSSSWITLSIALAIFITTLGVIAASYRMPSDGWFVDRGAWGRYSPPIYWEKISDSPSTLQPEDLLLAVEGVPYDHLASMVASLNPVRPPNWKLRQTVRHIVLRAGKEVH